MKNRNNSHDTDDLVEALRRSGTHCIVLSDADRDLFLRELLRPRPRPRPLALEKAMAAHKRLITRD